VSRLRSNTGNYIEDFIRIGQVSSVNPLTCSCRVAFDDMQDDGTPMVSYDMQILQHRTVKRQDFTLPEIGEHVLCVFLPNGNQEGFILASFYTGSNLFEYPIGSKKLAGKTGIYRSHYADDSEFEYDFNTHILRGYTNHADIELGRIEGERLLETGKTTVHIKVNGDNGIINLKAWNHSTGEQTAEANIDGIKGQIDVTASGDINVSSKKAIRASADENIIITSSKNIRIWADARLQIRAEEAIRISSGERITMVAPEIQFNPENDPDYDVSFIKEDESQLYLGDEGEGVLKLQEMLRELGYDVPLTGVFCQDTLEAVNAFKDEFLPDGNNGRWRGLVGAATLEALDKAVAQQPEETPANDVEVLWGPNANRAVVNEHAINILKEIAAEAGVTSFRITSTLRSIDDQIRIMYENVYHFGTDKNDFTTDKGREHYRNRYVVQRGEYGTGGQAVLNAGEAEEIKARDEGMVMSGAMRNRVMRAMMGEANVQINEHGRNVGSHTVSEEQYARRNIIDISYSAIVPLDRRNAFHEALRNAVGESIHRYQDERSSNSVYHVEINIP